MQCISLQQGTKIRYHWFSVLGFRISFCNKGLLCYQISQYMSKQKTLTCSKTRKCLVNLREKGKWSECVTPVTLLFSAGSLQLLSNCQAHYIPTFFQGFDFRSFSCSTSMFILWGIEVISIINDIALASLSWKAAEILTCVFVILMVMFRRPVIWKINTWKDTTLRQLSR